MSVKGLAEFQQERQRVRAEYRVARDFSLISEERLRFIGDFCTKIGNLYNRFGTNPRSRMSFDEFIGLLGKDPGAVVCGFPGYQSDQFKSIFQSVSNVSNEIAAMAKFATMYMQREIQQRIMQHESKRKDVMESVRRVGEARRRMWRDIENAQAANRKIAEQTKRGYSDLERARSRNQEKNIASCTTKLSKLVASLVASNRDVALRVETFNDMNRKYLHNLIAATQALKALEVETLQWGTFFFKPFGETMNVEAVSSREAGSALEQTIKPSKDLQEFMIKNRIFRTALTEFGAFRFGAELNSGNGISKAIVPAVPSMGAYPLAIGKAIFDFQSDQPRELSFKKGDWIALLELPAKDAWCLAYIGDNKHNLGYVPSQAVRLASSPIGICTCAFFGVDDNELSVSVGDVVIIADKASPGDDEEDSTEPLEMRIPLPKYQDEDEIQFDVQALSPRSKADAKRGDLVFCETLTGRRGWLPKYAVLYN